MHSESDLESVVAGENPMRVAFVTKQIKQIKQKDIDFVEVKTNGLGLRICVCIFITSFLSPMIICDLYFALTDTSCVNQDFRNLQINMHDYLFVTAIIGSTFISIINLMVLFLDIDIDIDKNSDTFIILNIGRWICKLFFISWLVLGCTIFWSLMDNSKCSKQVYSYLLARFIIYIVGSVLMVIRNDK